MPNDIKVVKRDDVLRDDAKMLREAAKQMTGQADRTNNLFVDVLLDVVERLERIEAHYTLIETQPVQFERLPN